MKICTKCKVEKPVTEYNKHSGQKSGLRPDCKVCYKKWRQKHYKENRVEILSKNSDWIRKNPQKKKEYSDRYSVGSRRVYTERNRNRLRLENRVISSRRRAIKNRALPGWADLDLIKSTYAKCYKISKETGIIHHVDHIIPLSGRLVSGLHVHNNLRIIPAKENMIKNNKLLEELL